MMHGRVMRFLGLMVFGRGMMFRARVMLGFRMMYLSSTFVWLLAIVITSLVAFVMLWLTIVASLVALVWLRFPISITGLMALMMLRLTVSIAFMTLVVLLPVIIVVIVLSFMMLLLMQLDSSHILRAITSHESLTLCTLLQVASARVRSDRASRLLSALLDTLIEVQMPVWSPLVATSSGIPTTNDAEGLVSNGVFGAMGLRAVVLIWAGVFEVEVFCLTDWTSCCWVGYNGQRSEEGG